MEATTVMDLHMIRGQHEHLSSVQIQQIVVGLEN